VGGYTQGAPLSQGTAFIASWLAVLMDVVRSPGVTVTVGPKVGYFYLSHPESDSCPKPSGPILLFGNCEPNYVLGGRQRNNLTGLAYGLSTSLRLSNGRLAIIPSASVIILGWHQIPVINLNAAVSSSF
jgi:hypothetical protein